MRDFRVLQTIFHRGIASVAALGLTLASVVAPLRAQSPASGGPLAPTVTRAGYEACQAQDEAIFRRAIETVTVGALERGVAGLDLKGLVSEEWRRAELDRLIGREVDRAIEAVKEESSFGRLLESIVNPETARQLATPVAERVYRSEAMKGAMENLAIGVGREIGKRIELATVDSGRPAALCIEAFLGPRYGATIAKLVASEAGREFAIDPAKATAEVTPGSIALEGSGVIAGAVILIVRRQLATLTNRLAQRLVGVALGRVASTVVSGVGVVLIAKDIWDFRHGVMPIIAEEMKSPATRETVQVELARTIGEQVGEHVKEIGARTSERVIEIWHEFRRAHGKVLEIADRDPAFKHLLDTVRPDRLPRLDEAVALILASEGEAAITRRLADGTLNAAIERIPEAAFQIARDLRSLELGFAWHALAGDLVGRVAEDELHRRNKPAAFTRAALSRLLGLNDRQAAGRLAALDAGPRDVMLELSARDLRTLARALSEPELNSLSGYVGALEGEIAKRLVQTVVTRPEAMLLLAPDGVRAAVLASRDKAAALAMLLRAEGQFDWSRVLEDVALARHGAIEPRLILTRHPLPSLLAGIGGLMLLSLVWRMLFGRRGRRISEGSATA
ncbi:MAG: hypothetical protein ACKVP7_04960 [Hyphomicrobiaceae bacterium]